ncbi:hypothetical protein [Nocardia sp. NRRL S-836]|uniref:hypothetical protein n=1 Tax=Nocardia sp. NRRL S-836 TaxID=1519492 RepID=UPI0006AF7DDA|nr:hypothetical protein [Nocardia sp. NRRL S-836]KOV75441.1 hypothetical protein ADL03_43955 [Nocardia sp. NRRL S-836]
MAGGGAVALLLRAAALGGFTAAAWLMGGHVAAAGPEHTDAPPAVEITVEAPALTAFQSIEPAAQPSAEPQIEPGTLTGTPAEPSTGTTPPLTDSPAEPAAATPAESPAAPSTDSPTGTLALVQAEAPSVPDKAPADGPEAFAAAFDAPGLFYDPAGWATAFTTSLAEQHEPITHIPAPDVIAPNRPEDPADEDDDGPTLDFSGGSHSNSRSGTISNRAPPEVLRAKAQARAARLAAKAAAALPAPAPQPARAHAVATKKTGPLLRDAFVHTAPQPAPAVQADLTWTEPGHDAPMPAPQPAPVTATASASSSPTDNSGGTRGVLAVLASRNELFPPATWSVEERRDGRSPGSLPGLPSTSPD